MKHQNNLLHTIDALNDLAAETNFVAAAVGALGQSESSGLALIIQRWSDTLSTLADDVEVEVAFVRGVHEDPDDSTDGVRAGLRYFIAPIGDGAPRLFCWIVADEATARVVAHGSAENWSAADDAATTIIKELEAAQ